MVENWWRTKPFNIDWRLKNGSTFLSDLSTRYYFMGCQTLLQSVLFLYLFSTKDVTATVTHLKNHSIYCVVKIDFNGHFIFQMTFMREPIISLQRRRCEGVKELLNKMMKCSRHNDFRSEIFRTFAMCTGKLWWYISCKWESPFWFYA